MEERAFQLKEQVVLLAVGKKGGGRKGRTGGLQGEHLRRQSKHLDKEAEGVEETSFPWHSDTESIEKAAETMQIPAPWLASICRERQSASAAASEARGR